MNVSVGVLVANLLFLLLFTQATPSNGAEEPPYIGEHTHTRTHTHTHNRAHHTCTHRSKRADLHHCERDVCASRGHVDKTACLSKCSHDFVRSKTRFPRRPSLTKSRWCSTEFLTPSVTFRCSGVRAVAAGTERGDGAGVRNAVGAAGRGAGGGAAPGLPAPLRRGLRLRRRRLGLLPAGQGLRGPAIRYVPAGETQYLPTAGEDAGLHPVPRHSRLLQELVHMRYWRFWFVSTVTFPFSQATPSRWAEHMQDPGHAYPGAGAFPPASAPPSYHQAEGSGGRGGGGGGGPGFVLSGPADPPGAAAGYPGMSEQQTLPLEGRGHHEMCVTWFRTKSVRSRLFT